MIIAQTSDHSVIEQSSVLGLHTPNQNWINDDTDRPLESPASQVDVATAMLAIGYETLGGHPILPQQALLQAADDIRSYGLARTCKDPQDAWEYYEQLFRNRQHIVEFLRSTFGLVEDLHTRGVHTETMARTVEALFGWLGQISIRQHNQFPSAAPGQLCTRVWQAALQSYWPDEQPAATH